MQAAHYKNGYQKQCMGIRESICLQENFAGPNNTKQFLSILQIYTLGKVIEKMMGL